MPKPQAQENVAGRSKAELYAAHKKARAKTALCMRVGGGDTPQQQLPG